MSVKDTKTAALTGVDSMTVANTRGSGLYGLRCRGFVFACETITHMSTRGPEREVRRADRSTIRAVDDAPKVMHA